MALSITSLNWKLLECYCKVTLLSLLALICEATPEVGILVWGSVYIDMT